MKSPQEGAGDYFSLVLGGWISFVCSFRILSTNCDTLTPPLEGSICAKFQKLENFTFPFLGR